VTEKVQTLALPVLAALALIGVFASYITKGSVPSELWTLATVLVGAVAGVSVPHGTAQAPAAPVAAVEAAPYIDGQG
jgi:hypothetical protein